MASSSARRWTCVYTKDIHKKQKHRKKYEDGVLDVWEDQNNKTRLFAADDDGNPKGEALAFGNLSAREISALVDGDDIRIEGYDVTPEEEQGAGGDTKATGAAVANPPFAPRVTIARPRAVAPAASMANIRKPFNQPFKPPAFTARPKAVEEPPAYKAARMSPEPEDGRSTRRPPRGSWTRIGRRFARLERRVGAQLAGSTTSTRRPGGRTPATRLSVPRPSNARWTRRRPRRRPCPSRSERASGRCTPAGTHTRRRRSPSRR